MKVDIIMPKMGESINEGTIIKWHKKVGDEVKKDEIIYEISTDKVDTEIPCPADGKLVEIKAYENETVPVNEVVAIIETDADAKIEETKEEDEPSTDQIGSVVDVPMPKMGESIFEGTIIEWHKKVGDTVKVDEIIYEISTDKVDTEVPSPVDGTIVEILYKKNDVVEVGKIVARISTKSGYRKVKSEKEEIIATEKLKESKSEVKTQAATERKIRDKKNSQSNKFFSPLVLNIASKEGITMGELESIVGTGISGRVTKKDILNYIDKKGTKQSTPAPELSVARPITASEEIPMDNIRKRIMEHMINSRDTSVHVTEIMEVDMTKIYNYIKANKERFLQNENLKLTYMAFISYAAVKALKEFPLVNASISKDKILLKKDINLGIAVAVEPNGLIVPNIKNADEKNIRGMAKAISELSRKARTKGLSPDDIMGGTFSITNYGVFGALFGTPIINQPEVAILGVGAVVKRPVVISVNGQDTLGIKPMMYLSLSHDHRLVDGLLGGKFLKSIKDTLQNFDVGSI
ncbi:MAG: 2-oxoglutarate dehydrogenase [Ignavibacteriae bacterium]|nr:MAG: 2-oxoglutarate dehydrogenase [Ignavibacteriota bacterium]